MLHNKASEGLIKPDRLRYDLYSGIVETKANFLKYCKPFEKRIRSLVPTYRVVPAGDGEDSTSVSVPGFLVDAKKTKKPYAPQQVDLAFLENHKTLYLDLHREFTKSEYAPQSEAALQNFKTLLMLEIAILLGCDLEWAKGSSVDAAVADPPVLTAAAAADDDDASHSEASDAPGRAELGARAPAPAEPNAGDDTNDAGGGGNEFVLRARHVKSTPVRGMASPRRGRPPFNKTFRLVPWRSGLKTDHTASTLPKPNG